MPNLSDISMLIIEAASNGMLIVDHQGKIILVNRQVEKMFGYQREELLGQSVEILVPMNFRDLYFDYRNSFFMSPQAQAMGAGRELFGLRKDRSQFPVEIGLNPLTIETEQYALASVIDITERKQAEEKLKKTEEQLQVSKGQVKVSEDQLKTSEDQLKTSEDQLKTSEDQLKTSEDQLRILIESVHDCAIFMLDQDGNVMTWNSGAEQIEGYKSNEIIGKRFSCFYTQEDIDSGKPEKELSIAATKGSCLDEGWRIRKNGSRFWADVIITAIHDNSGNVIAFSQVTRDLTESKRMEKLKELNLLLEEKSSMLKHANTELEVANTELESFSYSVSHDLRAPLRAINGFVSFLLEDFKDQLEPKACEYLDIISKNATKMGQLIDDLLAFSRITRKQLTHTRIDMEELMNEVFREEQTRYPARVLQLQLKPMPQAFCDRSMIKQVIINLVSNAIKFTKHRAIAEIELGGYMQDNKCVYYVKDNGIGFDMRFSNKLFQPFQRLVTQKDFEGTGIGLALVQRIIHKHGGKAWAEGAVDVGTTIYFTLPVEGGFSEGY